MNKIISSYVKYEKVNRTISNAVSRINPRLHSIENL